MNTSTSPAPQMHHGKSLLTRAGRLVVALYLVGLIFFSREWTVVGIGPVFTTDITILLVGLLSLASVITKGKITRTPFLFHLILILLIAIVELARGLFFYQDVVMSLRQFAPFLYMLTIVFMVNLYETYSQVLRLLKILFYLSTASVLVRVLNISDDVPMGHYSGWGISVFIGAYLYYETTNKRRKIAIGTCLLLLIFELFSLPVRGAWIALALSLLFCLFVFHRYIIKRILGRHMRRGIAIGFLFLLALIGASSVNPDFEERIYSIINVSHSFSNESNATLAGQNTKWRYLVWKDMLIEYTEKPLLGYGFGKKFMPPTIVALGWSTGDSDFVDPHNSHVHLLYMLGAIGFVVFELYFIRIIFRYFKIIRQPSFSFDGKMLILSMLGGVVYILVLAGFEVVLESPYMILYLWIILGMLFSVERIFRGELAIRWLPVRPTTPPSGMAVS